MSTGNECDPTVNKCPSGDKIGHSLSIVHLSSSLKLLQAWQAPGTAGHGHDWDFGSSPTLFGGGGKPRRRRLQQGRELLRAGRKPAGQLAGVDRHGRRGHRLPSTGSCIASAVWNEHTGALYLGGTSTTVGGTSFGGSIRQVNPATGAYIWQTGLPCSVMGTPTLDSAGVLALGTYSCVSPNVQGAYLVNAATGAILKQLPAGSGAVFGQLVFAQGNLFVATKTSGLYDFAP